MSEGPFRSPLPQGCRPAAPENRAIKGHAPVVEPESRIIKAGPAAADNAVAGPAPFAALKGTGEGRASPAALRQTGLPGGAGCPIGHGEAGRGK
ncbi:hypothetical protein [uncultured Bilophila sp.]|uniref:hypothetical protein n=1 Tax=uncultured Bilophila sp. TaxID=529385 RepID=UPI0026702827|nr:hypothetical protein [uncultured Bilophila sp.]